MKTRVTETIDFSGKGKNAWAVIRDIYNFLSERDDKSDWRLEETSRGYNETSDYRLIRHYQKEI